jgi:hypothetical protein
MVTKNVEETGREIVRELVKETSVPQLRRVMINLEPGRDLELVSKGDWCGVGCGNTSGNVCGLGCLVAPGEVLLDVVDQPGRLGITRQELEAIRADLPALRGEILEQLSAAVRDLG